MSGLDISLHWIDYAIVAVYFAGVMAHGVWVARRNRDTADGYFLAGRALPWYLIGFSLYASNMSGASFVGLMGGAYSEGLAVFNYEWTAALILVFFAFFILPSYLRTRVSTIPEFLERRYDVRSRRAFSAFTIIAIVFIDTAAALYAGGLVISNVMGFLELWQAIAVLAVFAGIYTILGGLAAVVVTDTVQAVLLIAATGVMVVLGLWEVGGWAALFEGMEPRRSQLLLPADDPFLPWTGLPGVLLIGFYYWTFNQFVTQRTLGAENLRQGRRGALFAGFLKLPNLFLMILPGVIAYKLYPELATPDLAFPALAFDLMPVAVRGLVMAALIAAIMSSLDSALNAASTCVTLDFVKATRPGMSESALVVVGRAVTGIAMVISASYAPLIAGFENLFSYLQTSLAYITPPVVVVYVGGLFFRGLAPSGAFWTLAGGLVTGIVLFVLREVTDGWQTAGLPALHYTELATLIALAAVLSHWGLSTLHGNDSAEHHDVMWDPRDLWDGDPERAARPVLGLAGHQALSLGLLVCTAALVWVLH